MTQIIADVINDPTLPRTEDHPCPKCNHKDAVFFQSQSVRAEVSYDFHCMFYVELNNLKCKWTLFYERWKTVLIKYILCNSRKECVCTMCVDHQRVHIDGLSRISVAEILLHLPVMAILLHYVRTIAFTRHFNDAFF